MDEFARAATLDDLKNLLRSLENHGVEYLLIGGYALAAHGYQRATTDIDVMVKGTAEVGERMKSALMVLPDQVAKDIEPEWFNEGENIRVADAFIVDIMLNANGQTYDTLKQYAQTVDLDGIKVTTVSLEGLLLTKRTTREKDQADCAVIERALAVMNKSNQVVQTDGLYVGPVVAVEPNCIGQKSGRDPKVIVWHSLDKLQGKVPVVGDMVEINHAHGVGVIKDKSPSQTPER